jgi:hypothetical protein
VWGGHSDLPPLNLIYLKKLIAALGRVGVLKGKF